MRWQEDGGRPIIITDAFKNWPAVQKWNFEFFKQRYGHSPVKVNDRAPARRADLKSGPGMLQTRDTSLGTYIDYVKVRHATWFCSLKVHPFTVASKCPRILVWFALSASALTAALKSVSLLGDHQHCWHGLQSLPSTLEELRDRAQSQNDASTSDCSSPFYLNGWRAFSQHPKLAGNVSNAPGSCICWTASFNIWIILLQCTHHLSSTHAKQW